MSSYERHCSETERGPPTNSRPLYVDDWDCIASLPCNQLDAFPSPRAAFERAAKASCDWCISDNLGWAEDCELSRYCYEDDRPVTCLADACTCYENEQPIASCDAGGICNGDQSQPEQCCGWMLGD